MMRTVFVFFSVCTAIQAKSSTPLFAIQRSLNANEVHYDLNLNGTEIDSENPLSVYWILNAKDGSKEELSDLEKKKAYGFTITKVEKDTCQFSLVPLPKDTLSVKKDEKGSFMATLPINGKESKLETIYVETEKAGPIPRVIQIEIRGKSLTDGSPVLEKRKF